MPGTLSCGLEGQRLHLHVLDWRGAIERDVRRAEAHARAAGCEAVIMGTRGMGPLASVMVGSVALKTIHLADVPVTLVK